MEKELEVGIISLIIHQVSVTTTDSNAYYVIYAAPGAYSGMISGYVDTPLNTAVASKSLEPQQNGTVIRAAASEEMQIMLSWDKNLEDLDSHLTGPSADGIEFHIAYYNKEESKDGITYLSLDWDIQVVWSGNYNSTR